MLRRALLVATYLLVPTLGFTQTKSTKPSLQGVWKVTEVVTMGSNPSTNSSPQPGLWIFTKKYYSQITVNGTQPRKMNPALPDATKATDAEKLVRYDEFQAFAAQSGTYEVKGTTLTRHPTVAKNVGVMTGPPIEVDIKLDSKTLVIIGKPRQPGGYGALTEVRTKLVRIE